MLAALWICQKSVPMEMMATNAKEITKIPIPIGAFATKSAVY